MDQDTRDVGPRARAAIDQALRASALFVSAICFWEVAVLRAKGRITFVKSVSDWRANLLRMGLIEVPVDGTIGILSAELNGLHPDPADRLIAATAVLSQSTLVTADRQLLSWRGDLKRMDATK